MAASFMRKKIEQFTVKQCVYSTSFAACHFINFKSNPDIIFLPVDSRWVFYEAISGIPIGKQQQKEGEVGVKKLRGKERVKQG